ncbi:tyrosine-type recombinase/integrase [bacterium]|nr:tyrosine-type recombinase/integrase [bacterium]
MRQVEGYKGLFYIIGKTRSTGEPEKIYYIRYRKDGKEIKEKAGRQFQDNMTPAKAHNIRSRRMQGLEPTRAEKREAKEINSDRWTIKRLWEEYKNNKTKYKGLQRDQSRFNVHIMPEFGEKEPKNIVTLDIDRFRNNLLKKKKLSPQTVKNTLELLRRVINYGSKKDLIPSYNIRFEMPSTDNMVNEVLSNDQIKSLLSVLDRNPFDIEAWLLKVMLYTGRRTGEICELEWSDIDLERQTFTLKDTKTGKTEYLPFSERVMEILKTIPRFHQKYIFPNTDGSKRTRVDAHSRELRNQAGIPETFRPSYCLRHTFASIAASNDIPERVLKALLGHTHREARKDITSRYAHVSHERLLQAVNQIADIIDRIAYSKENIIQLNDRQ